MNMNDKTDDKADDMTRLQEDCIMDDEAANARVQVAKPVTLKGIWPDLVRNTPGRLRRVDARGLLLVLRTALCSSGFHMLLIYRLGAWFHRMKLVPIAFLFEKVNYHLYHCIIPSSVQMGPAIWVPHPLGIVLNGTTRIGQRVRLSQYVEVLDGNLEVGLNQRVVGDDVRLYSGAVLLRYGSVGEGSIVAARAVVTKPVPPRHLAVGMPARFRPIEDGETPGRPRTD